MNFRKQPVTLAEELHIHICLPQADRKFTSRPVKRDGLHTVQYHIPRVVTQQRIEKITKHMYTLPKLR